MESNIQYRECYIAFLDIMGFKNLINEKPCDYIYQVFEKIKNSYAIKSGTIDSNNDFVWEELPKLIIETKLISDSICLSIDADKQDSLLFLIWACYRIQYELLKFDTPIFIRGGIVKGNIYMKDNVVFGPGLTKAYLLEEQNAKYPRIILTKETIVSAQGNVAGVFEDFDRFYTIEYYSAIKASTDPLLKERIFNYVYDILSTTTDNSLREKFNYFLNTYNFAISLYPELLKKNSK